MSQASERAEIVDTSAGSATPPVPRRSAVRRFFLLEEALRDAEARRFGPGRAGYYEYERAKEAERAIVAIMAQASDAIGPALLLAREGARWALRAQLLWVGLPVEEGADLFEALSALPLSEALERALSPSGFQRARALTMTTLVEATAVVDPVNEKADLALLRELSSRVLAPLDEASRAGDRVRVQRVLRIGAALAFVAALGLGATLGIGLARRGPNLALGQATSSSSAYGNQKTTHGAVDGKKTAHGFHTAEETKPWLLIDLGSTKTIGTVVVYNRSDCCEDRAVPLVVEASVDGEEFEVVARREKKFSRWEASFPKREARFVRLMAEKKTFLHLNEVEIYR